MSNARAAEYAYRAYADRNTAATFRKFGYHASAAHVERRADKFDAMAERENKEPPQRTTGALGLPTSNLGDSLDSDLHTTPYVNEHSIDGVEVVSPDKV